MLTRILIAGKDWQSRALLRAQLLEEGFDVEAHETVSDALAHLQAGPSLPHLLIADISASDGPTSDVEALSAWSRKIPTWIIAGRGYVIETDAEGRGFERSLLRPIDLGGLIEQIKQRLAEDSELEGRPFDLKR
jgi:DNA-binding NtrC family response regulator